MKFSASALVKNSARSLCYQRTHTVKRNLDMMIKGNELGAKKVKGSPEMRGTYEFDGHTLFYCFDDVIVGEVTRLVEHKSVQRQPPEFWYLDRSIVQTALYHSLLIQNPRKDYYTASFVKGKKEKLVIKTPVRSTLVFGNTRYRIKPTDTKKIVEFFLKKAKASLNYQSAKIWDDKWKHKEAEYIKKFVRVIKLGQ